METMPGYLCTLSRCKLPKKDWPKVPPCHECDKANDTNLDIMADQEMELGREKSMSEYLQKILCEEGLWRQVCKAVVERAVTGDLRAVELVMKVLGEDKPAPEAYRLELGPGVEELSR